MNPSTPICTQCGFELPQDARFCPQCGTRVADAAPVPTQPAAAIAGERRQVAVLFADLSGYTRLSSTQDPEQTHALLTRFFDVVDGAIVRMGGTIDKHIGDAVMGVFGAPVAYGNDVERAMRAALAIHEAIARLSSESDHPLGTHIGIASGEVIAAATGSAGHRSYTVTGDAVNLASRLTDLASFGETVVSDDVAQTSAAFARTEPLGSVAIRGLADGVRAWKLVGLHAPSHGTQPLFGRDAERERFSRLLARASRDRAGFVALLRADPGMGKSRLAEALLADATAAGAHCHSATVLDFGAARGHDAIQALACSVLAVPAGDAMPARRAALDEAIAAGRAAVADEPYLAALLLVGQRPGSMYDAMDNEARRSGRLRAFAAIVERAAARQPCVLLVEDVHWASEWVLTCLRALSDDVRRLPVALTMTTRRDGDPVTDRWPADAIERFELPPLAHGDALALARALLAATPDLAERCVERAQGNPLFLTQLLRSDTDDGQVPATIQSVVLARLDRLPPADKAAVQAAAVVGQRFPLELLRDLVGNPAYLPSVPVGRDLLRGGAHDGDFTFTHALIRDGAYASLLHATRRALHVKAALWYEKRDSTLRAEHLDRAEDPRAAEAYAAAARSEADAMRAEAALALAMRGRELPGTAAVRFELAALAGELCAKLGRAAESIDAFEQALATAGDDRERSAAWIGIASGHRLRSAVPQGLAALDAAAIHADRAQATRDRAQIEYLRGSLLFAAGDAGGCRRHHERALALAHEVGDAQCEAQALSGLADALYAQGRLRSARPAFIRCLDICERAALPRLAPMNHCMVAIIDAHFGRFDEALARLERARGIAREIHDRFAESMCDEVEGWVLVFAGRYADAVLPLTRGIELARAVAARRFEVVLLVGLARVRFHEGRRDEARRLVHEAWLRSEEVGSRFAGAVVLGAKALLAATAAERRSALADGERLLRDECVSHCYFGFYQSAIDAALDAGEWSEAERYAGLLEDYVREEPLPLIDFFVARGRALAAAGRGASDRAALASCRECARAWRLAAYLPALEAMPAAPRA